VVTYHALERHGVRLALGGPQLHPRALDAKFSEAMVSEASLSLGLTCTSITTFAFPPAPPYTPHQATTHTQTRTQNRTTECSMVHPV